MEAQKLTKSQFSIDDGEHYFEGYTYGTTWNGWACPHFELPQAMAVMELLNKIGEEYNSNDRMRYDKDKDEFVYFDTDNREEDNSTYPPHDAEYDGKSLKLYPVGAFEWVWWDKAWENE